MTYQAIFAHLPDQPAVQGELLEQEEVQDSANNIHTCDKFEGKRW